MDQRNIILTGFMGAGKTAVGRALARLLDRAFVDMDAVIQEREGMPIAELFAQKGEAYFRERESALCRELASAENLVVATGGGALVNPDNRAAFGAAHLVCLDARPETILARLDGAADRPLLQGDPRANVERLLAERRAAYAAIPLHIQTDDLTPERVAQEIVRQLEPREIAVKSPEGMYPIILGNDLLEQVGDYLSSFRFAARGAIVTNPIVGRLYGESVREGVAREGFEPTLIEIPDGERSKNLDTVRTLYDRFIEAKLERRSPILALGGGVIGDTVGFAAATYLRGVPLIQIPTTLLAMVDSSIGGKVAVDHPSGKNLIGAFKFPLFVVADLDTLETLPDEEYRAGMAEVIKHGIIGDAVLFRELQARIEPTGDVRPLTAELVERALRVKVAVVQNDPYEEHVRAHLNLGHTFGQALERLAEYRMRHGDAVAMGVAIAARLAANLGVCAPQTRDEIIGLLTACRLPTTLPHEFAANELLAAMGTDKKIRDGKLRLILPQEIGRVEIADNIPRAEILRALEASY